MMLRLTCGLSHTCGLLLSVCRLTIIDDFFGRTNSVIFNNLLFRVIGWSNCLKTLETGVQSRRLSFITMVQYWNWDKSALNKANIKIFKRKALLGPLSNEYGHEHTIQLQIYQREHITLLLYISPVFLYC